MYHLRWQQWIEDPLCLSLGQWKSLIRPWPANERRLVDGPGEEKQRGRQFLEMITDSFPCLSCLWKEKERPPCPPPPKGPPLIVSQPLTPPLHRQHPSKALIGPSLITLAPCSFTFAPVLWQICFTLSINDFLRSSVLSLHFSCCPSFLRSCSIVELRVPTCKQFPPTRSSWVPVPFHTGAPACPGPCLLQVGELARTEVNGWKSLTNLSNSCLQSPLFLVLFFNNVSPCFFFFSLALLPSSSLLKNSGWGHWLIGEEKNSRNFSRNLPFPPTSGSRPEENEGGRTGGKMRL